MTWTEAKGQQPGYLPQTHWLVGASEVRLWGEADTCVCRKLRFGPLEQDRARRHSSTAAARLLVDRIGSNRQRISTVVGDQKIDPDIA
jgi:hypothetical protein